LALIFSSGGGRLGNQLLNIIHLSAFAFEYGIEIYKINDLYIKSKKKNFLYKLEKNKINWEIISDYSKVKKIDKLFLKIFIRMIHLYYYLHPNKKSYKIVINHNLHKFIFGINLNKNFSKYNLIQEAEKKNIVLSGWGLRDWDLVLKHKESIVRNLYEGFLPILHLDKKIRGDYLFVHMRRSDFLEIAEFKELNFSDEVWLNSIFKICSIESIKNVVIFSDSNIDNFIISELKKNKIDVLIPNQEITQNNFFLDLFVNYLCNAKSVICNSSTLVLSISFLFHEKVYLPSKKMDFQKIFLDNAHNSYPTSLNWN